MGKAVKGLLIVLGIFEFVSAIRLLLTSDEELLNARAAELPVIPAYVYTDPTVKLLFCTMITFLGLLRVIWVVSGQTYASWFCIVATHFVESAMFWQLALLPHFNKSLLQPNEFVIKVITLQFDAGSTVILLLVPVLAFILLMSGPNIPKFESGTGISSSSETESTETEKKIR